MKKDPAVSESPVMDIEDLVKLGNLHKFCPYYMAWEIQKEADIIFMPYNYLFYPKVRKSLGIVLSNNVVILDEAHNIKRSIIRHLDPSARRPPWNICLFGIHGRAQGGLLASSKQNNGLQPHFPQFHAHGYHGSRQNRGGSNKHGYALRSKIVETKSSSG
ncbi:unnamed protein product [Brassicogethes aeneus]|nr:unnamed protein product [Brassicogethes aeneus]